MSTLGDHRYNQTHYDSDNPPPKVVQGYKFKCVAPPCSSERSACVPPRLSLSTCSHSHLSLIAVDVFSLSVSSTRTSSTRARRRRTASSRTRTFPRSQPSSSPPVLLTRTSHSRSSPSSGSTRTRGPSPRAALRPSLAWHAVLTSSSFVPHTEVSEARSTVVF